MAKVGDIVRYLNSVGGGRIVRIQGQTAYVDEDGFETPVLLRECVVVSSPSPATAAKQPTTATSAPTLSKDTTVAPKPEIFVVKETPEGERLNVVLGYEPVDIKRLSTTTFHAYLVNDSNYYLSFAYMTRSNDTQQWTLRMADTVEPGIQLYLGEVLREDLTDMDHVAIQYIAYKRDRGFEAKSPAMVDIKVDTTKFFKLHCFQPSEYFEDAALTFTIVKDDTAYRQIEIDPKALKTAMREKGDNQQHRKPQQKKMPNNEPLVIDLHINELVDNTNGLSNADMLNLQIDTFRKVMDENIKNHGRKIIFIHGKGEGVLRNALLKELNYRYKGHDVQDASFLEYGYGATQVKIK